MRKHVTVCSQRLYSTILCCRKLLMNVAVKQGAIKDLDLQSTLII
jgi:hypothetical protein